MALEQSHFLWKQLNLSFHNYDKLDLRLTEGSKPIFFNHFENTRGITTKTGLIRTLNAYYESDKNAKAAGYSLFDTTPTTFVVSNVSDDSEINLLLARYRELAHGGSKKERVPFKHCE